MKAKDRSKAKQYLYYDMIRRSEKLRIDINKEQDPFRMLDKALLCIYFLTGDEILTIKSNEIKKENNNNQRREKRRNENGLTDKQQELLDLKKKAESLRNKGLSNRAIAKEFGCSEYKIRSLFK